MTTYGPHGNNFQFLTTMVATFHTGQFSWGNFHGGDFQRGEISEGGTFIGGYFYSGQFSGGQFSLSHKLCLCFSVKERDTEICHEGSGNCVAKVGWFKCASGLITSLT